MEGQAMMRFRLPERGVWATMRLSVNIALKGASCRNPLSA
ncbi:hypothetical protein GCWU000324_01102 [Kingella oralis ATCC 51147]|uniref:Uncharacterized protein n=1 Tax=Kingella oralis ATCC 51147 TaxID=629741 RepID=C4GG35_9NEIS|nr:hypothetical protein GCWU000324_01102 [Kingella oralis ATCC 51147]